MQKYIQKTANLMLFTGTLFGSMALANTNENSELTGDRRTACEVLLCLSSGQRPGECNPPLRHFYSIKGKKPGDTLKKRKKF